MISVGDVSQEFYVMMQRQQTGNIDRLHNLLSTARVSFVISVEEVREIMIHHIKIS